jgi:hypothetical protein
MARPRLSLEAAAPLVALAPLCNPDSEVGILLLLFTSLASRCTMQRAISLPFLLIWEPPVIHQRSHCHSLRHFSLLKEEPCNSYRPSAFHRHRAPADL